MTTLRVTVLMSVGIAELADGTFKAKLESDYGGNVQIVDIEPGTDPAGAKDPKTFIKNFTDREAKLAKDRERKRLYRLNKANPAPLTKAEVGLLGAQARWAKAEPKVRKVVYRRPEPGQRMEDYAMKVMEPGKALHRDTIARLVYEAGYRGSRNREALKASMGPLMATLKKAGKVEQSERNIYTRITPA